MLDDDAGEFVAYLKLDDALELDAAIIDGTACRPQLRERAQRLD